MWCDKCQADVAAQAASDRDRPLCAVCGGELNRPAASAAEFGGVNLRAPLHDPRELLARWAREDALGTIDADVLPVLPRSAAPKSSNLRFDAPHPAPHGPLPHFEQPPQPAVTIEALAAISAEPGAKTPAAEAASADWTVHHVHGPHGVNPPHIQVAPLVDKTVETGSKWMTLVGQLFAYFGVGGLFVGTVLVLLGYYGGTGSYATTGWLVATAGQSLLFLGVITLVSGGMEQTTHEVARRIDTLGDRLERIEKSAVLSGPPGRTEPA